MRVLSGESARAVAHSLGMPNNTFVLSWLRAYREKGVDGLKSRPKGRKKHAQEESEAPGAGQIGNSCRSSSMIFKIERVLSALGNR